MGGQGLIGVDTQLTCNSIPVDSTSAVDMSTVFDADQMTLEFDSSHDFGPAVGRSILAIIEWYCEEESILRASGYVRLLGATAGREETVYHYVFHESDIGKAMRGAG